jgi:muramoyltetrapeptide carboxypeptidase
MKKQLWRPLQKGDLIDIVAPGMKPTTGVVEGIAEFLSKWGLRARIPQPLIQKDLLCSANTSLRLRHLTQALQAQDSKMIWCVRGGYGSIHLLDGLKKLKPQPAKIFLGLSDITTLHSFLNQSWGWSTIHGCNLDRFALGSAQRSETQRLYQLLFGLTQQLEFRLRPENKLALSASFISGKVVGGNLITLQSSLGTPDQIHLRGKILFVEDIGERAYRVDRVFEHMRQSGALKGVKAIVFGQFTGGKEPGRSSSLITPWIKQYALEQKFPVFSGLSSGHGPNQHPLPLNTPASLMGGTRSKLTVDSGSRV